MVKISVYRSALNLSAYLNGFIFKYVDVNIIGNNQSLLEVCQCSRLFVNFHAGIFLRFLMIKILANLNFLLKQQIKYMCVKCKKKHPRLKKLTGSEILLIFQFSTTISDFQKAI